jgi:hypothetical protein
MFQKQTNLLIFFWIGFCISFKIRIIYEVAYISSIRCLQTTKSKVEVICMVELDENDY